MSQPARDVGPPAGPGRHRVFPGVTEGTEIARIRDDFHRWFWDEVPLFPFGNIEEVPYLEAKKLFAAHAQSLLEEKKDNKLNGFTAGDILDLFLEP